MRILFDNLIFTSSVSADDVNANYPVTNLQAAHLTKIYKSTTTGAEVTITFQTVQTVNCCYIGFTNASAATVALYNASDTLIKTVTLDTSRGGKTFTAALLVKYAIVTLAASDVLYVGTIGIGNNYTMPDPDNNIVAKPVDRTSRDFSNGGQLYANYRDVVQQIDATFSQLLSGTYNEIFALFAARRHSLWIDIYEENTGIIKPLYCDMTTNGDPSQSWKKYQMKFTFIEVR
jgi:hypothetical protein